MMQNNEVKLAPPGAGLPRAELFIARILYPIQLRLGSRESFRKLFESERASIHELISSFDPDDGGRRILIDRPIGIEDSSRYWSLWMTLDHLRILNVAISHIIGQLSVGVIPPGAASTASVKPSPEVTASIVTEYEESCDFFLRTTAEIPNLRTPVRYKHPWFGAMDAYGWHALSGVHLGLHRVQIQRIFNGLLKHKK